MAYYNKQPDGPHRCPTCGDVFLEAGPMQCHHAQAHGESLVDRPIEVLLTDHNQAAKVTQILAEHGYETEGDLQQTHPEDLLDITGIGRGTIAALARNMAVPWEFSSPFMPGSSESDEKGKGTDTNTYPQVDA